MELKDNDAEKWLKNLTGTRHIEPKEESKAMESFMYGNPEDSLDRIRGIRKAQEKKVKKVNGR